MSRLRLFLSISIPILAQAAISGEANSIDLTPLPPEHRVEVDSETGAKLTYLSTSSAAERNLYFHERSWTADGAAILFQSDRDQGGLMAYLTENGALLPLSHALGELSGATAAIKGCGFYALRGSNVLHVELEIDSTGALGSATALVQTLATLPNSEHRTSLNENCAGTLLSIGLEGGDIGAAPVILTIDVQTGAVTEICRTPNSVPSGIQHVQWSHTDPNMISYAGHKPRLMVVDIRDGHPGGVYPEWADELVTHESWWVRDQIIFCGGTHPRPTEDSHVKIFDMATGTVRVVGVGAWWPNANPKKLSRHNWWHADGSDDGRWIVADNWHGDIALFEGKTTRPRLLSVGHRKYGQGDHPHVGFDRAGRQVIFVSHKNGNPDVCLATIPEAWQQENPS